MSLDAHLVHHIFETPLKTEVYTTIFQQFLTTFNKSPSKFEHIGVRFESDLHCKTKDIM